MILTILAQKYPTSVFFNIILIIFLKKDTIENIANWMKKIYNLLKTSY
jgi:hypothetical protein